MNLENVQKLQKDFDKRHGFPIAASTLSEKYAQISKDLVGLLGEMGEFANIVKKVNLGLDRSKEKDLSIAEFENALREELIDGLVYILRLATILDVDVEAEYIKKMSRNEDKYREYK